MEKIKITKLAHSQIEIAGEISVSEVQKFRTEAIKKIQKDVELDGFRKGHVPESVLVSKLGEVTILEEAAEIVLGENYPKIVAENKIDAIGRPQVVLTKVAPENPIGFKITTSVVPEIELPEYKKIAKAEMAQKEEKVEVSEKEISDVIEQVQKSHRDHGKNPDADGDEVAEKKGLPELTPEFLKTLGDFKDLADFKEKIKTNILSEKEAKAKNKKRLAIVEKIVDGTKIELPEILVESELNKMGGQFEDDIERMGIKSEDYLKHIKKTKDDLRKEWRTDAEKRAKLQIIFNKISVAEKIQPSEIEVTSEAKKILEHYKEANPVNVHVYVETVLTNEKVFAFLESQK